MTPFHPAHIKEVQAETKAMRLATLLMVLASATPAINKPIREKSA